MEMQRKKDGAGRLGSVLRLVCACALTSSEGSSGEKTRSNSNVRTVAAAGATMTARHAPPSVALLGAGLVAISTPSVACRGRRRQSTRTEPLSSSSSARVESYLTRSASRVARAARVSPFAASASARLCARLIEVVTCAFRSRCSSAARVSASSFASAACAEAVAAPSDVPATSARASLSWSSRRAIESLACASSPVATSAVALASFASASASAASASASATRLSAS